MSTLKVRLEPRRRKMIKVCLMRKMLVLDDKHKGIIGHGKCFIHADGTIVHDDFVDLKGLYLPAGDYTIAFTDDPDQLVVIPDRVM